MTRARRHAGPGLMSEAMRTWRAAAILSSHPLLDLTPRALLARRQGLLRALLADGPLQQQWTFDAPCYRAMRTALLAAGATPPDVAAIAAWLIQLLLEAGTFDPEDLLAQIAQMCDHLVGEVFDVCLDPETVCVLRLEFPDRPTVH